MPMMKKYWTLIFLFMVISGTTLGQTDTVKKDSAVILTSKKDWYSRPALPDSIAQAIARNLLDTNQIFKEKWSAEWVFVYGQIIYDSLPEQEVTIKLVDDTADFQMTWYGFLFWGFGKRWGRMHNGLDIDLEIGDTVVAAFEGVVRYATMNSGGYGKCVVIRHLNGLETLYGHLSQINVVPNQYVRAGQFIGLGGSTGRSNGPHLHFETRWKDLAFDPYTIIDTARHRLINDTLILKLSDWTNYAKAAQTATGSPLQHNNNNNTYTPPVNPDVYIVRSGDCLYNIARRYGTTVDRIKKLNGLKGDIIYPGQKLKLR
jgi:hypothetical protein